MNQNYINHIALVLDASGSMSHLSSAVVQVADNQVQYLAARSKELDQETRATASVVERITGLLDFHSEYLGESEVGAGDEVASL